MIVRKEQILMKRIKKTMSFILAMLLIFNIVIPVSASGNSTLENPDIKKHMLRVLASVEQDREYYGLAAVDFSEIQLGTEIPTYKVFDDTLIKADIRVVPITDNEEILSFFYIATDESGECIVQISNELVVPLYEYIHKPSIALIYDVNGVYAYDGTDLHLIGLNEKTTTIDSVSNTKSDKDNLDSIAAVSIQELKEINRSNCLSPTMELDVMSFKKNSQELLKRVVTAHYLPVDIISQPTNTNICWAIAITSIINYVWDSNWTYSEIVNMFNDGVDEGMHTSEVIANLNSWFTTDWSYSYTTTIAPNVILNYLYAGYPLFGDFTKTSGGAHAVVIRGVNTAYNTFSVMNPNPSTSGYTSGTISSTNKLTFVSGYSGSTYTLRSYGFPTSP